MAASPQSVTLSFHHGNERPVVSSLGLSAGSDEFGVQAREEGSSVPLEEDWEQPHPSRKAMWRCHHGLDLVGARTAPCSTARKEVLPEMKDKCFSCLEKGHFKRVCTNDIVCIRCELSGHGSKGYKRPRSPSSEEELRRVALTKVARRGPSRPASGASPVPASSGSGTSTTCCPPPPPPPLRSSGIARPVWPLLTAPRLK